MIERIHERASKTTLLVAIVATAFFSGIMMLVLLPQLLVTSGGRLPLDMRFAYSPSGFYELAEALGSEGIALYHLFHIFDMGFPISLAVTLSSAIALINREILPPKNRPRKVVVIPFITALFDYLENFLLWYQLDMYPLTSTTMLLATSLISAAKMSLLMFSLVVVAGWIGLYILKREKA